MIHDSKRPWWADPAVVADNLARREFDVSFEYLQGLADLVESAIAYGPEPAKAATAALTALEASTYADYRPRFIRPWGGESVAVGEVYVGPLDDTTLSLIGHLADDDNEG
ncbi:hypothetical protein SEA_NERGAL_51 [Mycobacterium Phage Nergal]|nr:hypothetical protein SEA_NERGAL_51 [Mycobacterium Phage Nergal]